MRVPLLIFCLFFATCSPLPAADEAQRLVALADYIGGDYKNAVRDGRVINSEEYQEMKEFSARTLELVRQLKTTGKGDGAIESSLKMLASHIERKESEKVVRDLARRVKEELITAYRIALYPRRTPSLQGGETVFSQNCAQCHGETGKGDGPGMETMKPKVPRPANFTDPEFMASLSPFKAFNTATFGVARTAMPDFSALTEEQRWEAAFYLFSFRFSPESAAEGEKLFEARKLPVELKNVATLATLSDEELRKKIINHLSDRQEADKVLAYLRRGILLERTDNPLLVARTLLREAMELYRNGEAVRAYQKAVDAYLEGFELVEPALFAEDLSFGRALEGKITAFRSALKRGDSADKVQRLYREADAGLVEASQLLSRSGQLTGYYIFLNASLIILREGLEAALILAAILALLRVTGAPSAARYIHLGWVLALLAGLLTWLLAQTALEISGSHRESMEGFTSLAAALVLLYVGYWLHTKAEARRWRKFIEGKAQEALPGRNILALAGLSFFTVYREAFETVLFYQALYLQVPHNPDPVIWGFIAGTGVLGSVVFALLKLGLKIPVQSFFSATGAFLYLLSLTFAGQGVRELQTAGWFSVTPLTFPPPVRFLGLYPTLETLMAQGLMLVAFLASLLWLSREHQKSD